MTTLSHPLSERLAALRHHLFPLARHTMADETEQARNAYALLLAATLSDEGNISAEQEMLLRSLLAAMGLKRDLATLLGSAQRLTGNALAETIAVVARTEGTEALLADGLILARISAPLAAHKTQLFSELAQALEVDEAEFSGVCQWVQYLLFGKVQFSQPIRFQRVPAISQSNKQQNTWFSHMFGPMKRSKIMADHLHLVAAQQVIAEYQTDLNPTSESGRETLTCNLDWGVMLLPQGSSKTNEALVIGVPEALLAWHHLIDFTSLAKLIPESNENQ